MRMLRQSLIVLALLLVCGISASAQLPSQHPLDPQEWETYLQGKLVMLYRNTPHESLAKQIKINVTLDPEPNAQAFCSNQEIDITYGMIQLVANEDQLMGILAHEMGHIVNGDKSEPTSFEVFKEEELKADEFAFETLKRIGYDPCQMHSLYKATLDSKRFWEQSQKSENAKFKLHRLEIMSQQCKSSPSSTANR